MPPKFAEGNNVFHTVEDKLVTDMDEFVGAHKILDKLVTDIDEFIGDHRAVERFGREKLASLLLERSFVHTVADKFGTDSVVALDANKLFMLVHRRPDKLATDNDAEGLLLTRLFMTCDHTTLDRFGTESVAVGCVLNRFCCTLIR